MNIAAEVATSRKVGCKNKEQWQKIRIHFI
jgi:hypothetical protein